MPKKFYDLYPPTDQISLPANPDIPVNMPYIAWTAFGTLRRYDNTKDRFTGIQCNTDPQQALSDACNFADDVKREIRKRSSSYMQRVDMYLDLVSLAIMLVCHSLTHWLGRF